MHNKITSPFSVLEAAPSNSPALARLLERCARTSPPKESTSAPILTRESGWSAEFFGLDRSSAFRSLEPATQEKVLRDCSIAALSEALHIEISGMAYTAKMSLLAETLEQRELYSHFSADEANHFRLIRGLVGEPSLEATRENGFLRLLGHMIEAESRPTLVFLIQVILEGWGIPYYHQLAEHARHPEVADALRKIVADEAKHHGSGLLLFNENDLSAEERVRIEHQVGELLTLLRLGPVGVLIPLLRARGGMSEQEIRIFLEETQFQIKMASDLELLMSLMTKAGAHRIVAQLRDRGFSKIPSAEECARAVTRFLEQAA